MERDPNKHLYDMLVRARILVEMFEGVPVDRLDSDRLFRSAAEREFSVLGEALYQLRGYAPHVAEKIEHWNAIIGFRHRLIHGYDAIEPTVLWQSVREDLPLLIEQLEEMLPDLDEK